MPFATHWLTQADQQEWNDALASFPKAGRDIYFEPGYGALYEAAGTWAECFVASDGEERFVLPLLRSEIARKPGYFDLATPYGYGGPLSTTVAPEFLNRAFREFAAMAQDKRCVAVLLKFHPVIANQKWAEGRFPGRIVRMRSTIFVEVDQDEEYRWTKIYTHANRKNINKAKRSECRIVFGADTDQWDAFLSLYKETMSANAASAAYDFSPTYFERIKTLLRGRYVLVSCMAKEKPVSVLLVLLGDSMAHCHLIGTSREWLTVGVNNLLHHELILWCKQNGYGRLHIGGGRSDAEDDSLLRFKQNFSDKTGDFCVGEWVLNDAAYSDLRNQWLAENPGGDLTNRLLFYRGS